MEVDVVRLWMWSGCRCLVADACCSLLDYYNNGGGGASGPGGGASTSPAGPSPASYGSYYQNDGGYATPPSAPKPPAKKPPMHQGSKAPFASVPGVSPGPAGGYQAAPAPGQSPYNPYGYGPGKKKIGRAHV